MRWPYCSDCSCSALQLAGEHPLRGSCASQGAKGEAGPRRCSCSSRTARRTNLSGQVRMTRERTGCGASRSCEAARRSVHACCSDTHMLLLLPNQARTRGSRPNTPAPQTRGRGSAAWAAASAPRRAAPRQSRHPQQCLPPPRARARRQRPPRAPWQRQCRPRVPSPGRLGWRRPQCTLAAGLAAAAGRCWRQLWRAEMLRLLGRPVCFAVAAGGVWVSLWAALLRWCTLGAPAASSCCCGRGRCQIDCQRRCACCQHTLALPRLLRGTGRASA